jgi:hypothetical protein
MSVIYANVNQEAFTEENWITGNKPIQTLPVKFAAGLNLPERAVVGIVTATGEATLSVAAATDGSQVPRYITAIPVDTTLGAKDAAVYVEGCFNPDLLVLGAGHTANSVNIPLQDYGLYLQKPLNPQ